MVNGVGYEGELGKGQGSGKGVKVYLGVSNGFVGYDGRGIRVYLFFFFFFKQKTAYEFRLSLVGSEMYIKDRDRIRNCPNPRHLSQWHPKYKNGNAGNKGCEADAPACHRGETLGKHRPRAYPISSRNQ